LFTVFDIFFITEIFSRLVFSYAGCLSFAIVNICTVLSDMFLKILRTDLSTDDTLYDSALNTSFGTSVKFPSTPRALVILISEMSGILIFSCE